MLIRVWPAYADVEHTEYSSPIDAPGHAGYAPPGRRVAVRPMPEWVSGLGAYSLLKRVPEPARFSLVFTRTHFSRAEMLVLVAVPLYRRRLCRPVAGAMLRLKRVGNTVKS